MKKSKAYFSMLAMGAIFMESIVDDTFEELKYKPVIERDYPKYGTKGRFHRLGKQRHATETRIDVRTKPKTGRNDPCTCGSGIKYKKCCIQ